MGKEEQKSLSQIRDSVDKTPIVPLNLRWRWWIF